jgi:diketogulonate reductase-like aldo/keto reductase
MKCFVLSNGKHLPAVGLGTWKIQDREVLRSLIGKAYENGYRMLDTAAAYCNEIGIGKAIRENAIPREELYIIDKVWNTIYTNITYERMLIR